MNIFFECLALFRLDQKEEETAICQCSKKCTRIHILSYWEQKKIEFMNALLWLDLISPVKRCMNIFQQQLIIKLIRKNNFMRCRFQIFFEFIHLLFSPKCRENFITSGGFIDQFGLCSGSIVTICSRDSQTPHRLKLVTYVFINFIISQIRLNNYVGKCVSSYK